MSADYLSDAEAEAMLRAADPGEWQWFDDGPMTEEAKALWKANSLAAIRRAWAARPATARRLDETCIASVDASWAYTDMRERGRHLLSGMGEG